uniref:uncharacterized protein LOC122589192 n=1 Tax=Erigeron canadensis TaxID=72917 RepID=UPI001CB8C6A8|nr:uncharacterized protein LOC122589192 [Erigeron canadensis]
MAKEFSDRDELVSKRTSGKTVAKLESGEESSLVAEVKTLTKQMNERQPRTLPSNTQQNPKPQQNNQGSGTKYNHPNARNEQVNAITTRVGNTYNSANALPNVVTPLVQVEQEGTMDEEIEMEPNPAVKVPVVPSKNVEKPTVETPSVRPYQPKVPFPQRLKRGKIKENFKKLVELIQNVNISVPLVDLLAGMPNYAKFLKDLISDRKKLQEDKTAVMSAEDGGFGAETEEKWEL